MARRYKLLVMSHLSSANPLAAGIRIPPALTKGFAATQAAWRFYANEALSPQMLAVPLIELAREQIPTLCKSYVLTVLDWSNLHFESHGSKKDKARLSRGNNQGYKLLSALTLSDQDGTPIAPVYVELLAKDGLHCSRSLKVLPRESSLDSLTPVIEHVAGLGLGKQPVAIIDAEADSVGHYRQWDKQGHLFLIRSDARRLVRVENQEQLLSEVAGKLPLAPVGKVAYKGRELERFIGQTPVILTRPARQHRVINGQEKHVNIPGEALALRLVVSELRDPAGKAIARWLLLTNVPEEIGALVITDWYLWRWRIEDCHKQLKGAGQQVESWQQETAEGVCKRLCVALMSLSLVWQLAREKSAEAGALREVLVRLSGRQIKRGKDRPTFTISALLTGLGVLLPALAMLEEIGRDKLQSLVHKFLPGLLAHGADSG